MYKEAKHSCRDFGQKICDTCKDYHRKLAMTRNHTIVPVNKTPAPANENQDVPILCGCNNKQKVAFFCETHQDVICSACKSFQHHNCQSSSIQERSSGYNPSTFDSLLYKIKRLKNKYNRRKQETAGIVKELKQLKEACKKEIKSFRNELHSFLDNLEKNMLAELDKWERDESRRIEQNISVLATSVRQHCE